MAWNKDFCIACCIGMTLFAILRKATASVKLVRTYVCLYHSTWRPLYLHCSLWVWPATGCYEASAVLDFMALVDMLGLLGLESPVRLCWCRRSDRHEHLRSNARPQKVCGTRTRHACQRSVLGPQRPVFALDRLWMTPLSVSRWAFSSFLTWESSHLV